MGMSNLQDCLIEVCYTLNILSNAIATSKTSADTGQNRAFLGEARIKFVEV